MNIFANTLSIPINFFDFETTSAEKGQEYIRQHLENDIYELYTDSDETID